MKRPIFILLIFFSSTVFAQDPEDNEIIQLIGEFDRYVCLCDSANLGENIQPYYPALREYFARNGEEMKDYYVNVNLVFSIIGNYNATEPAYQSGLHFYTVHIDTFRKILEIKKTDPKRYDLLRGWSESPYHYAANASGKDGLVNIPFAGEISMTISQ